MQRRQDHHISPLSKQGIWCCIDRRRPRWTWRGHNWNTSKTGTGLWQRHTLACNEFGSNHWSCKYWYLDRTISLAVHSRVIKILGKVLTLGRLPRVEIGASVEWNGGRDDGRGEEPKAQALSKPSKQSHCGQRVRSGKREYRGENLGSKSAVDRWERRLARSRQIWPVDA